MTRTADNVPQSEAGDSEPSPAPPRSEEERTASSGDLHGSSAREEIARGEPDDPGEEEADAPTKARVEDLFRKLSRTTRRAQQAEQARVADASSVARAVGPLPLPPRSGVQETEPAVVLSPSLIVPRPSSGDRDAQTVMSSPSGFNGALREETTDAVPGLPADRSARVVVGLACLVCVLGLLGWYLAARASARAGLSPTPPIGAEVPSGDAPAAPPSAQPVPLVKSAPPVEPSESSAPASGSAPAERQPPAPAPRALPRSPTSHTPSVAPPASSASAAPNRVKTVLDITE